MNRRVVKRAADLLGEVEPVVQVDCQSFAPPSHAGIEAAAVNPIAERLDQIPGRQLNRTPVSANPVISVRSNGASLRALVSMGDSYRPSGVAKRPRRTDQSS